MHGRSTRTPIARTVATAALALGVVAPLQAGAADRYALAAGAVVHRGASTPAKAGMQPISAAATPASPRYTMIGASARGEADSIFADGFDLTPSYDYEFAPDIALADQAVELGSVSVPAGSYAVFVRLHARTGDDPNPGNNYRFDCEVSPGIDYPVYRVGTEALVERYLNYQGTVTLPAAGTIGFSCRSANGHLATALGGKLTVLTVGGAD